MEFTVHFFTEKSKLIIDFGAQNFLVTYFIKISENLQFIKKREIQMTYIFFGNFQFSFFYLKLFKIF